MHIRFDGSLDSHKYGIFGKSKDTYVKYYSSAKCLADNKITVLFRGRVIFKQYKPMKHKILG